MDAGSSVDGVGGSSDIWSHLKLTNVVAIDNGLLVDFHSLLASGGHE
jgi:hypothetical protein